MQTWQDDRPKEIYRQPTTSEEILSIFLNEPEVFPEYKGQLKASMFQEYGWLYRTIAELDTQDSFTYKAVLLKHYDRLNDIDGLKNSFAATGRLPLLIQDLKRKHLAAEIYRISATATEEAESRNPDELLAELQDDFNKLSSTEATELHDPERDVDEHFRWMEEIMQDPSKAYGMMTGLEEIDRITTGFHKGDFIVVGARTSVGKSAFQIEMALRLMKNGHKVAIYSLEMSKRQIYLRMLANLMHIQLGMLKFGRIPANQYETMLKHKQELKKIYIDDSRGVSADYIVDSMKRLKRTRGIDVVMVDYIQDVKEQGETNDNGGSAIGRVCRKLRAGAQQCDCAMFGLSQVKREVEDRKDKRPMPSDLAGSTGIETAADVIALLYREDHYDPYTEKKGLMEVNFAKQRNGELGKVELFYAKQYQQLRPWETGRY